MKKALILLLGLVTMWSAVSATGTSNLQSDIYFARDRVLPALVHIQPVITDYRTGREIKQSVVGSGVIFRDSGYVVTNYHVAGKAERIICTLDDKEQVKADLIGGDPLTDIAIIKLDLSDYNGKLSVAALGDSDSLQVGQYVLAMGSPLALSRSVSCGVISTTDRYFSDEARLPSGEKTGRYNTWIQTDAAINPGNSGGPLVDLEGRVVGINSRATIFANNIGFAIPINIVKQTIDQILDHGKVIRSWIGIQAQAMQDMEGWFGTDRNKGVLVSSVDTHSPAETAGLQAGDVILKMNGKDVAARFEEQLPRFYKMIADFPVGTKLDLEVQRAEKIIYIEVTTRELGDLMGKDLACDDWGFTVKAITKQMAVENQLDDTLGVLVTGVKRVGPGAEGGLRRGDVIRDINEIPTPRFKDFYDKYNELIAIPADKVLLTVKRFGNVKYVLLKITKETDQTEER